MVNNVLINYEKKEVCHKKNVVQIKPRTRPWNTKLRLSRGKIKRINGQKLTKVAGKKFAVGPASRKCQTGHKQRLASLRK